MIAAAIIVIDLVIIVVCSVISLFVKTYIGTQD